MDIQLIGGQAAVEIKPHRQAPASPVPVPQAISSRQAAMPVQLTEAVRQLNDTVRELSQSLEFSIDEESNRAIVKVIDRETKQLIRQMPSEETLEIARTLDRVQGLLIRLKA